jgi:aspartyl/asparaginyl-tRNA synthetase
MYAVLGLIPHAGAGLMIERALHEYLGLFWAKLRGQAR